MVKFRYGKSSKSKMLHLLRDERNINYVVEAGLQQFINYWYHVQLILLKASTFANFPWRVVIAWDFTYP